MDKNIVYTTPSQQLELLKKKNLIINDEISALNKIERYGFIILLTATKSLTQKLKMGKEYIKPGSLLNKFFLCSL